MEKMSFDYKRDEEKPPMMMSDPDWGEMPYRPNAGCETCKGSGFIHPHNPDGKVDYSRVTACTCLLKAISRYKSGNFAERKEAITDPEQTFATFKPLPGTEKALKFAKELAYGGSSFVWLLLYGGFGNGKTHLCQAIARVLLENEREVQYVTAADMFSDLRAAIGNNTVESLMRELKQVFFLIIDEWGLEYGSDWEQAKFDEIMTARFANARPTVLATNRDVEDLPPRLRSRFQDTVLARYVKNSGSDQRKTKKGR